MVNHVLAISGQEHDAGLAAGGRARSSRTTARAATARRGRGCARWARPKLTDAVWLYGGDAERIEETVRHRPLRRDAGLERGVPPGRAG